MHLRHRYLLPFALSLALAQNATAAFEATEWGTFTSLVGSNGITQNGMYHEDEPLPSFVHGFGVTLRDLVPPTQPVPPRRPCRSKGCFGDEFFEQNQITQKMETPVIYFYSDQQRRVSVNVRFPEGVVTETYPAPVSTSPSSGSIREAANGNTTFLVDVLPTKNDPLPTVEPGNIYGHARAVDANTVQSGFEKERFIFYRGIGRFQPRLGLRSERGELSLNIRATRDRPSAIFLVHVNESGDGQMIGVHHYYGRAHVGREEINRLSTHTLSRQEGVLRGGEMSSALITSLVQSGLKQDEATAMIRTWENGYLRVPGLRLLYVLPRAEVDEILPLQITPAPDRLARVFVGRIEVLLDTEESRILDQVLQQGERFEPASLGRFAEPMLRRVREVYLAGEEQDYRMVLTLNNLVRKAAKAE